ncbi:MAG TPA: UDP-glucuronic acid decarboxylase family protein [Chloroflexota bacterium]|jgi:nucleoside-diphosphate-sugar epimerase
MKLLVAGGAGFVGSHLCERLLDAGHAVVCVDSLITGDTRNVAHLRDRPGFEMVQHDVVQPFDADVDGVFHLASPASPVAYHSHPEATALANAVGSQQLLSLARRRQARYLFASTSEIYGDPEQHPQSESYWGNVNPVGPRACYDESKRFGEALTMVYLHEYKLDARIIRIFNTYGPRSDPNDGRLVPNFVTQALHGEPLTVYGDGSQTRSLCYVDDLVRGIELAMFAPNTTGAVVNLGNPEEHTVLEYAELIRELVDPSVQIIFRPLPADDPTRRCPDISRARKLLGWEPRVPLREGLERTIGWFRAATAHAAGA